MSDQTRILLIDGAAGIYVPRNFYENFDLPSWGLNNTEYSDLSDPNKELYWDAWDDAIQNAIHHDDKGHTWTLEPIDGELFAVRDDHNFDEDNA